MQFKFNVPNKITIIRITLVPLFVIVLLANIPYRNVISAVIFALLSVSDFFDGYIARKKKQITDFGKLIDPIADKILISTALVFLVGRGVELWMAVVIIAREFILTAIRIYLLPLKLVVPASNFGKAKTVVQSFAIVMVLLELKFGYYMMLVAVFLTVVSGLEFMIKIRKLTGNKIVNLPNLITLVRFFLIIPFVYYLLNSKIYLAIIIFGIFTLSDKLDGISARIMNQKTEIGSFFDAFTDWTFMVTTLILFIFLGYFSYKIMVLFLIPLVLGAMIKIYYFKKRRKILTSSISKMAVGFAYISTLVFLIDFIYKYIFIIIALVLSYAALITFAFKTRLSRAKL